MSMFTPPESPDDEAEYYALMGWLAEVPLFKKQLSPAELPLIARSLEEKRWNPGSAVVKQGQLCDSFYIVKSGTALVILQDAKSDLSDRLVRGDFFGARSLVAKTPMPATICAAGPEHLITLSLSREVFETLGLNKKITFPPRPAIDVAVEDDDGDNALSPQIGGDLITDEIDFISRCICTNANLSALVSEAKGKAREIAKYAKRRHVKAGEKVLQAGSLSHALIIVGDGMFESREVNQAKSAEEAVLRKARLADGMMRRAELLKEMAANGDSPKPRGGANRHRSLIVGSNTRGENLGTGAVIGRYASMKGQEKLKPGDQVIIHTKKAIHWVGSRGKLFSNKFTLEDMPEDEPQQQQPDEKPGGVVVDVDGDTLTIISQGRTCKVKASEAHKDTTSAKSVGNKFSNVATRGTSLGELSLIYNVYNREDVEAVEDSLVYEISRRAFKAVVKHLGSHKAQDIEDFTNLLDEVPILTILLRGQRMDLARNATGRSVFKPGEVIFEQGKARRYNQWYIVEKGDVEVTRVKDGQLTSIAKLHRAGHFGERLVLQGRPHSECTVTAGTCGATCLTIDAAILKALRLDREDRSGFYLDMKASLEDYYRRSSTGALSCIGHKDAINARSKEVSMDRLDTIKVLGRGGFGAVSLVRDRIRKDVYAMKKMSKGKIADQGMERRIVSEREIMARVDSPFIIRFFRSFKDKQFVYFLLEVAMGGDLLHLRQEHGDIFEHDSPRGSAVAFYIACISLGLQHLHDNSIVFRDLKPENILLTDQGYAKLCDFGFARFCFRKSYTFLGTPEYMAPEMIDVPHRHDRMVDWWAVGVMAFELWSGSTPFNGGGEEDPEEQVLDIRRSQNMGPPERSLPRDCSKDARDFIRQLLKVSPASRLGCKAGFADIQQHPWFTRMNFGWEALRRGSLASPYQKQDAPDVASLPALDIRPDAPPSPEEKEDAELFMEYKDDGSHWDAPF